MHVNEPGNETQRGLDTFVYDQANRLANVAIAGSQTFQYTFDGDGKRASSGVSGQTPSAAYTYDTVTGSGGLPVLLDDGSRKYVWGLGQAYNVVISTGAAQVYHEDGLRSVRAITDNTSPNPLLIQAYRTDEFGIPVRLASGGSSTQPLQYTGQQRDAESSFMYLRARMYDPQTGRFQQSDPVRKSGVGVGGWNRYTYVGNNPILFSGPAGLKTRAAQDTSFVSTPETPAVCDKYSCFHVDYYPGGDIVNIWYHGSIGAGPFGGAGAQF